MTVVLTVVLSVVSRSVTDITITTYEEEAQRAFDAAEAGIEQALLTGATGIGNVGDATYDVAITFPSPPSNDQFVYPDELVAGESATFWFVKHNETTGKMECPGSTSCLKSKKIDRICWGKPDTLNNELTTPAIELTIFYDYNPPQVVSYGNFSQVKLFRKTFDPNPSRIYLNKFNPAYSCSNKIGGKDFAFSTGEIDLSGITDISGGKCGDELGCLLMVKVRMFYNTSQAHPIALGVQTTGGTSLPSQGQEIESTGMAGESTRKVNVFKSFAEPPFVFDAAVFSFGDLIK